MAFMAGRQTADGIQATVALVRAAITRFSSSKGFNEQNTKASLIVEKEAVRKRFAEPNARLFPVAVIYLVPRGLT